MNKQKGTALVFRTRPMRAACVIFKGRLERIHRHSNLVSPSFTRTAPNYQYMFKGHPLTFDSHGPLCDLLLSAKGFEEHSNWGVSKVAVGRKRLKRAKEKHRVAIIRDVHCKQMKRFKEKETEPGSMMLESSRNWAKAKVG